mgnify:CR=1 FL=1
MTYITIAAIGFAIGWYAPSIERVIKKQWRVGR